MTSRSPMQQVIANSSLGEAMQDLRASPFYCEGPRGEHVASKDAERAQVLLTRCIACRQEIRVDPRTGGWRHDVEAVR